MRSETRPERNVRVGPHGGRIYEVVEDRISGCGGRRKAIPGGRCTITMNVRQSQTENSESERSSSKDALMLLRIYETLLRSADPSRSSARPRAEKTSWTICSRRHRPRDPRPPPAGMEAIDVLRLVRSWGHPIDVICVSGNCPRGRSPRRETRRVRLRSQRPSRSSGFARRSRRVPLVQTPCNDAVPCRVRTTPMRSSAARSRHPRQGVCRRGCNKRRSISSRVRCARRLAPSHLPISPSGFRCRVPRWDDTSTFSPRAEWRGASRNTAGPGAP